MRIGVDFDNTIVCYDAAFRTAALARGLAPMEAAGSKGAVRDYLRHAGREHEWTELQGFIYGPGMTAAEPFSNALPVIAGWLRAGMDVFIVSHKTRVPYLGPQYDLHAAGWEWLERQGFFEPSRINLPRAHVYFELTKQAKLERIAQLRCTHFIDDLPEFLAEPAFPSGVARCLFDVHNAYPDETRFMRRRLWSELNEWITQENSGARHG